MLRSFFLDSEARVLSVTQELLCITEKCDIGSTHILKLAGLLLIRTIAAWLRPTMGEGNTRSTNLPQAVEVSGHVGLRSVQCFLQDSLESVFDGVL